MAKRIRERIQIGNEQKWITGYSKQEVFEKAFELMLTHQGIQARVKETPLLSSYARTWFKTFKLPKLKKNTAYNYNTHLEKHIIPFFEDKRMAEVTTSDIQNFYNSMSDKAHSTVRCMSIIISGIFNSAIEDGHLQRNPAKSDRLAFTKRRFTRKALSAEEARDIESNLHKLRDNDRALLALLLYTGARKGEVLALKWSDINWNDKLLYIRRAVTFSKNQPIMDTTKSKAGIRSIPLQSELESVLKPIQSNGFVVGGGDMPISESAYVRAWQRIRKGIELHGATAHVFRHTYITMAASYLDIKTLQTIAGHSDISTTMNRYAHGREDKIKEAAKRLQSLYS